MRLRPVAAYSVFALLAAFAAGVSLPTKALAQSSYPNKPIRIIVPFLTGGPNDVLARVAADVLNKAWGQAVVVENRPGGGGNLGADLVAKSLPDGHTVLLGALSTLSLNRTLYASLPYDAKTDLAHVAMLGRAALMVEVAGDFPAKTLKDFIAHAKSKPDGLDYGSPGVATAPNIVAVWFAQVAGFKARAIQYRGTTAIIDAMLKGEISWYMDLPNTAIPFSRAGRVRLLAVTSKERWPGLSDVPTLIESGFSDFDAQTWFGLAVQAKTPREIVMRMNAEINKGLHTQEVIDRFFGLGLLPYIMTPQEMSAHVNAEAERWGKLIQAFGIKAEN